MCMHTLSPQETRCTSFKTFCNYGRGLSLVGRGFNVVNVAFTILEDGNKVLSASGNYSIGILKVSESDYHALSHALQDIISTLRV